MVTGRLYGQVFEQVWGKTFNWEADGINAALATSSYSVDQDTHDFWDDVSGSEAAGAGYTAKGVALTSKTVTGSGYSSNNIFALDAANATWGTSTITAQFAIVYYNSGSNSTSSLICYQDNEANVSTTSGTFTVAWHTDGIVKITVS